jgi:predicted 3-demethylubiquinone-9 3-methyltransferase (glyoxalase superfamily)
MSLMDSGVKSSLSFEQAISFVINCDTQEDIDYYWSKLGEGGQEIQCGWLKDKFGFPWQVVPRILPELLASPDADKRARVMKAMLAMKKMDIKALEEA